MYSPRWLYDDWGGLAWATFRQKGEVLKHPRKSAQSQWQEDFAKRAREAGNSIARNGFLLRVGTARLRTTVLNLVGDIKGMQVLDAGCGDGSVTSQLTKTNLVAGLDTVPEMLNLARANGLVPVTGSMESPPFSPGSFDLVLSIEAISLSRNPLSVVGSLSSLLRPGGRLIISCVNKTSRLRRVAECALDIAGQPYPRAVSLREIVVAFRDNGLELKNTRAVVSSPGFAMSVIPRSVESPILNIANNLIVEGQYR